MKFKIGIILIFLGSVFFTSEKFINTENTVKFYITIFSLFGGGIVLFLGSKNIKSSVQEMTSMMAMKGLYLVGVAQSLYGILQYLGKFSSNHQAFAVTGSFDNPAGFISVLTLLFPIGIYWCVKSKKQEQRFVYFSLGLLLFSIILSGSRIGLLTAIISAILICNMEFQLVSKIRHSKSVNLYVVCVAIFCVFGSFALYKWKPDSINGRFLVWKVSAKMIKDKPVLGFGHNGFQANYMNYQAQYFIQNPHSRFKQLADNVAHPFNEFIKITVNYGIIGVLLYALFISFIIWRLHKLKHPQCSILLGGYISFFLLSCFSYPLQYAPVWFLLGYFTLCVFKDKLPERRISSIIKFPILGVCFSGIIIFSFKLYRELVWKDIAIQSLQGKTQEMLPHYERLYPDMQNNPLFLYNYGAELKVAKRYKESITLLNQCQKKLNDYDLQILLATNYLQIGDTASAIKTYQYAENMIPCRFLPLYYQFEIYKKHNDVRNATSVAKQIITKQVKIKSSTVELIIAKAENYLKGAKEDLY